MTVSTSKASVVQLVRTSSIMRVVMNFKYTYSMLHIKLKAFLRVF